MDFIIGSFLSFVGAFLTYYYGRKSFLKPQFFIFIFKNSKVTPNNPTDTLKIIDELGNKRQYLNIVECIILTKSAKDITSEDILKPLMVYGNTEDSISNFKIIKKSNFTPSVSPENKLVLASELIRDMDYIHLVFTNLSDSANVNTNIDYKIKNFKKPKFYNFNDEISKFLASTFAFSCSLIFLIISWFWLSDDVQPYQLQKNYYLKKYDKFKEIDQEFYDGYNTAINRSGKRTDSILITGLDYFTQRNIEEKLEKHVVKNENSVSFKLLGSDKFYPLGKTNVYLKFIYNGIEIFIFFCVTFLLCIAVIIYFFINALFNYSYLWRVYKLKKVH